MSKPKLSWTQMPMAGKLEFERFFSLGSGIDQVEMILTEKLLGRLLRCHDIAKQLKSKTLNDTQRSELEYEFAHRVELVGHWLDQLQTRAWSSFHEFTGPTSQRDVTVAGIRGQSAAVVATFFTRAVLWNIHFLINGLEPQPFSDVYGEEPPVMKRELVHRNMGAILPWIRQQFPRIQWSTLANKIGREAKAARDVQLGSAPPSRPRKYRTFDANGRLETIPRELLIGLAAMHEAGESVAALAKIAAHKGIKRDYGRKFVADMLDEGVIERPSRDRYLLTDKGRRALKDSE